MKDGQVMVLDGLLTSHGGRERGWLHQINWGMSGGGGGGGGGGGAYTVTSTHTGLLVKYCMFQVTGLPLSSIRWVSIGNGVLGNGVLDCLGQTPHPHEVIQVMWGDCLVQTYSQLREE